MTFRTKTVKHQRENSMKQRAVATLKNSPSSNELVASVAAICGDPATVTTNEFLAIYAYALPLADSFPEPTSKLIQEVVSHNFEFLTVLVRGSKDESVNEVCRQFVVTILEKYPHCLNNYLGKEKVSKTELLIIKSYFCGSKLFNFIQTIVSVEGYSQILLKQFQSLRNTNESNKIYGDLLISAIKIHPVVVSEILLGDWMFLNKKSFRENFIDKFYQNSTTKVKKRLNQVLLNYLGKNCVPENIKSLETVMQVINPIYIDYPWITYECANAIVQYVYIECLSKAWLKRYLNFLLIEWGVSNIDKKRMEAEDIMLTKLLVACTAQLETDEKMAVSGSSTFVNSITQRLSNHESSYINRTMLVAKEVVGDSLKFEPSMNGFDTPVCVIPEGTLSDEEPFDLLGKYDKPTELQINRSLQDLDIDSDDEDSDGETPTGSPMLFIRDLIQEFTTKQRSSDDTLELLETSLRLIRTKKNTLQELEYYSDELINVLAKISNTHDHNGFEQLRIDNIVAIVHLLPKKIATVMEILLTQDLSLQQRVSLLLSIGASAQILSGIDSRAAKPAIHDRQPQIQEYSESDLQTVKQGRVVWKSSKLDSRNGHSSNTTVNRFNSVAPLFFWPLANGWLNGIDLGSFDHLFKTHYLNTLSLVFRLSQSHNDVANMEQAMMTIFDQASSQNIHLS